MCSPTRCWQRGSEDNVYRDPFEEDEDDTPECDDPFGEDPNGSLLFLVVIAAVCGALGLFHLLHRIGFI